MSKGVNLDSKFITDYKINLTRCHHWRL